MNYWACMILLLLTPLSGPLSSHSLPSNHSILMSGLLHLLSLFMKHRSLLIFIWLILSHRSRFSSDFLATKNCHLIP